MSKEGPPVLVGESVFWLGSGSGVPKRGTVKWLGRLAEISEDWAVGLQMDEELPVGGMDGGWGGRRLFSCRPKHGLIVPAQSLLGQRRFAVQAGQTPQSNRYNTQHQTRKLYLHNAFHNGEVGGVDGEDVVVGRRSGGRTLPRDYHLRKEAEGWMVDRERGKQDGGVFVKRRRDLNRSLEEGLSGTDRDSYHSSRSAGSSRNRASGIFSIFRWLRKEDKAEGEDSGGDSLPLSDPGSPVLPRARSITGSVDTLFSTATANSFAFVHPHQYKPFGLANQPEFRIQVGPETSTYRNRIRDRDRLRELEKNISLREKYRLYGSGTLPRSVDHLHQLTQDLNELQKCLDSQRDSNNSTLGRKKRKAPQPPSTQSSFDESQLENRPPDENIKQHRRTVSEPLKFHVKGKRKAPPPPGTNVDPDVISISTSNSNSSRRSRKKRRAPSPPIKNTDSNEIVNIIPEVTNGIINEDIRVSENDSQKDETASNASTLDIGLADVVCTDTLKLERGILKPNMDRPYTEPKICPSSPVSPRPWYKRAANKDSGSVRDKDKRKERDRRKVEDWMLESGIPRRSLINSDNRYNIFSRADKTDDKRKSQISILTNISELDREAAEIIRRGKEREKTLIDSHNAMYYNDNIVIAEGNSENRTEIVDNSRRTARDLVSLFNAITHVTKVSANSSIFPKNSTTIFTVENKQKIPEQKYEQNFKNADNKLPIEIESLDEVIHRKLPEKPEVIIVEDDKPATSSASSVNSGGKIARVTIEELDEYDAERNSKAQVLYEANKQNRQLAPPIPMIAEVSEGSAKSSPTSTIVDKPSQEPQTTAIQLVQVKQMNVWICPRCTLENLRWRITCEACDMWRPNPFELREKINNPAFNGNRISKAPNKENNTVFYPNLTPIKTDSETPTKQSNIQATVEAEVDLSKPGKENTEVIERKQTTTGESSKILQKDIKTVDNKIMYDNEPKGIINIENNLSKSVIEQKHNKATSSKQSTKLIKETNKPTPLKRSEIKLDNSEQSKITEAMKIESKENSSTISDGMNDEIRKARLAFFNKPMAAATKEENPIISDDEKVDNSNLMVNEENKPVSSEKASENKIIPSEKNIKPNQNNSSDKGVSIIQTNSNNKDITLNQTINNNNVEMQRTDLQKKQSNNINDDIEKKKLKEMLIEMKHSLPKRPKPVKKVENQNSIDEKPNVSKIDVIGSLSSSTVPTSKEIITKSNPSPTTSKSQTSAINGHAEAYLIESETIIEEIKLKKPSDKVSSSVQTSGLVTQILPKVRPSSGKELVIPIKIEENIIKDGILYTTTSNGFKKIGTGTFQLMRPRDFANIKEVKTESKTGASLPVYANVADDDSNSSVKSEEVTVNPSDFIDKLSKQLVKPQGFAHFKARLDVRNDRNMNTLAVNRLLKRLEGAIASGQHELAAGFARELAQMKVNCSVIRQKQELPTKDILVELYVEDKASHQGPFHLKVRRDMKVRDLKELVETEYEIPTGVQRWILANQLASDDSSTLESLGVTTDGFPVFLYLVAPDLSVTKTEETVDLGVLPSGSSGVSGEVACGSSQGGQVPNGSTHAGEDEAQPGPSGEVSKDAPPPETTYKLHINPTGTMALGWKCETCTLMNSPTRPGCAACATGRPHDYTIPLEYEPNEAEALRIQEETNTDLATAKNEEKAQNYQKLVDLEKDDLIIYHEEFECPVCLVDYKKMEGIVLRECLHVFCRSCLANTIQFSDEAEVKCPFRDNNYTCDSTLLEREIKALVTPQAFEEHLAKSIALAETKIGNAFHCKTPDCIGWCIYEDNVNVFKCPVCTHTNCLTCQAVHEGLNCKQFQEELNNNSDMNIEVKRTREMLQEMVERGEAMNCPTCQVVLMKKWGCDWLRCSMCKTEICWITRGPRWGPNGKGDTSGGCQCGVNGIKCHPKCTYCH